MNGTAKRDFHPPYLLATGYNFFSFVFITVAIVPLLGRLKILPLIFLDSHRWAVTQRELVFSKEGAICILGKESSKELTSRSEMLLSPINTFFKAKCLE